MGDVCRLEFFTNLQFAAPRFSPFSSWYLPPWFVLVVSQAGQPIAREKEPAMEGELVQAAGGYTTPKAVADKLAISVFLVYDLLDKGELESLKVGRCRRILVSSLARFIARNTTPEKKEGQAEQPAPPVD